MVNKLHFLRVNEKCEVELVDPKIQPGGGQRKDQDKMNVLSDQRVARSSTYLNLKILKSRERSFKSMKDIDVEGFNSFTKGLKTKSISTLSSIKLFDYGWHEETPRIAQGDSKKRVCGKLGGKE